MSVHTEMKSSQSSRVWGRHSSFTLAALVLTTIFFWSWENKPLLTSQLSAQEQFIMHTSDIFLDEKVDSSALLNHREHLPEEDSVFKEAEDKIDDKVTTQSSVTDNANTISTQVKEENKILASSSEKQASCNYAKGRWVADSRRPLYSGFGCKQWLSEMWACRLTQRTDFSYEGYRWQPTDCEMRDFQGAEFLTRMRDKTIAFIGDSLGRQQFQSLMCMATAGLDQPEVQNMETEYGLTKPRGSIRPDGWAYRFPTTNTTILYYWSATLSAIEPIDPTDPTTDHAMHLDRPPTFLTHHLPRFDVVVLNTGHHWNRGKFRANKWVMHANGKPVTDRKLAEMGNAKNHTLHCIARWLDSQILSRPGLKVFMRTISPRHFSNGEWNTGGSCDNLTPLTRGREVVKEESADAVVEAAVRGTTVRILDVTALSELRDEGHVSRYSVKASDGINDCLHWCLPGVPDTWNELLYAQL